MEKVSNELRTIVKNLAEFVAKENGDRRNLDQYESDIMAWMEYQDGMWDLQYDMLLKYNDGLDYTPIGRELGVSDRTSSIKFLTENLSENQLVINYVDELLNCNGDEDLLQFFNNNLQDPQRFFSDYIDTDEMRAQEFEARYQIDPSNVEDWMDALTLGDLDHTFNHWVNDKALQELLFEVGESYKSENDELNVIAEWVMKGAITIDIEYMDEVLFVLNKSLKSGGSIPLPQDKADKLKSLLLSDDKSSVNQAITLIESLANMFDMSTLITPLTTQHQQTKQQHATYVQGLWDSLDLDNISQQADYQLSSMGDVLYDQFFGDDDVAAWFTCYALKDSSNGFTHDEITDLMEEDALLDIVARYETLQHNTFLDLLYVV